MKENINIILREYLNIFPNEEDKLKVFINFVNKTPEEDMIDWNNQFGHITAGAFVYAKKERKFLMLFHNEFKIYLYSGGHAEKGDLTPLMTAKRELLEETGLEPTKLLSITDNPIVPLDIDIHIIPENKKYNMSEHYHFDFRYLFCIDEITNIDLDYSENDNYKWITFDELKNTKTYGSITDKLESLINEL